MPPNPDNVEETVSLTNENPFGPDRHKETATIDFYTNKACAIGRDREDASEGIWLDGHEKLALYHALRDHFEDERPVSFEDEVQSELYDHVERLVTVVEETAERLEEVEDVVGSHNVELEELRQRLEADDEDVEESMSAAEDPTLLAADVAEETAKLIEARDALEEGHEAKAALIVDEAIDELMDITGRVHDV